MTKLLPMALLGAFAVTIVGCQASMDVDPPRSSAPANVDKTTTTVRDANGNVVDQKTTVHRDAP